MGCEEICDVDFTLTQLIRNEMEEDYSSDEDIHVGLGGIGFKRRRDSSDASDGAVFRHKVSFSAGGVQTQNDNKKEDDEQEEERPSFGGSIPMLGGRSNHRPTKAEDAHTSKYGIGAKLLGKMGYVSGQSLGNTGKGLVEPIEQKVRPSGLGLGGISEKTEKKTKPDRKRTPKNYDEKLKRQGITTRPKNIYKTIEEMEAEGLHVPETLRTIIDMSQGAEGVARDLQDVRISEPSDLSGELDTVDTVSLLYSARTDLESFHREWRSLQARKKYAEYQSNELETKVDKVMRDLDDLKNVIDVTERLYKKKRSQLYSVDAIADDLDIFQFKHINDLQAYSLDEVAVSSLAPLFQQVVAEWEPLDDPVVFREHLLRWKLLLGINKYKEEENLSVPGRKQSSPYESMMYHVWLPKVQSFLTNSWDIKKPASALLLLEEWDSVLPPTVKHTLVQRVVIPKLKNGIASWSPSSESPLHSWLFPWVPYLGDEMQQLLDEVKLKFVTLLRHWRPSKGSPIEGIEIWRELFGSDQLDRMLTSQLLPRLSDYLRKFLLIDPANQDITPLEHIMGWATVLRPTLVGHLLEDVFFPKWMEALHSWLVLADADLGEIYTWFKTWSEWFEEDIRQLPQVSAGFRRGLDLINDALDLGENRHTLPLPEHDARSKKAAIDSAISSLISQTKARAATSEQPDRLQSSFKDVVEEYCVEHDLFLVPLRRAHEKLGHALYKISKNATGSGGLSVYIDDDVLWIQMSDSYEPIALDDLAEKMGVS